MQTVNANKFTNEAKSLLFLLNSKLSIDKIAQNGCLRYQPIMNVLLSGANSVQRPPSRSIDHSKICGKLVKTPINATPNHRKIKRKNYKILAVGKNLGTRKSSQKIMPTQAEEIRKKMSNMNLNLIRCKTAGIRTRNLVTQISTHKNLAPQNLCAPLISCKTYSANQNKNERVFSEKKSNGNPIINMQNQWITGFGKENAHICENSFIMQGHVISPKSLIYMKNLYRKPNESRNSCMNYYQSNSFNQI